MSTNRQRAGNWRPHHTTGSIARTPVREADTPLTIFVPGELVDWWHAPDAGSVAGAPVASWPGRMGNVASQPLSSAQPTIANGINGQITVLFDGLNHYLQSTLQLPPRVGQRPFVFALARYESFIENVSYFVMLANELSFTAAGRVLEVFRAGTPNVAFASRPNTFCMRKVRLESTGGTQTFAGPSGFNDFAAHRFAFGYAAADTRIFTIDEVAYPTPSFGVALTTPSNTAFPYLTLGSDYNGGSSSYANVHLRDVVILRNEPSDEQRQRMTAFLRASEGGVVF